MEPITINSFKAYDLRGRIPDGINEDIAYRVGRAYADFVQPRRVAVGRDIRLSSATLQEALTRGLTDAGTDVLDIGLCGTEMIYFATAHENLDGGIMVTASHNPPDYNGMKFVREEARPISGDTGLAEIRRRAEAGEFETASAAGQVTQLDIVPAYIDHLLGYVDAADLQPLKVVVNAGNGGAGAVVDQLEPYLPMDFVKILHNPDGTFPAGVPNPMLEANRAVTADAIVEHGADLGIAWDGDFDRCFLFDEHGAFIEGYYIVGLLAAAFLHAHPHSKIVHDPRLVWNTRDIVEREGGESVQSKAGHAFIKDAMRRADAVYGGEMSAHHYFRDFAYADSGMIPWLLIVQLMSKAGRPLSELVAERMARFPASGEINREVDNPGAVLSAVELAYAEAALEIEHVDGISMDMGNWRFNLRRSNTEPLVRLNVESRGDQGLMEAKTAELLKAIDRAAQS